MEIKQFQKIIWDYYQRHGRHDLPWRKKITPYLIVVSEVMLQQTQVSRVLPKYQAWLKQFPSFQALAKAGNRTILTTWQGLGYNRRALALKKLAKIVTEQYHGRLPTLTEELKKLPGIGGATAGSIAAFAFNQPTIFIETNIRTVFLHHFFARREKVTDQEVFSLIEKTIVGKRPREWYWALMDYGVYLKQQHSNPSRRSAHHQKQPIFKGSKRELRGKILRLILEQPHTLGELNQLLPHDLSRLPAILAELTSEAFLERHRQKYSIRT